LGAAHVLAFAIIAMLENPLYVSQTSTCGTPALATCSHVMSYFDVGIFMLCDVYIDALVSSQTTYIVNFRSEHEIALL
jgi:hypothetical protein